MSIDGPALHQPQGGRLRADLALASLQRRAVEMGADRRFGDGVTDLQPCREGVRVVTGSTTLTARAAVVTTGAWTSRTLAGHVTLPPITVTQEQLAYLRPRREAVWPAFAVRGEPFVYGVPGPESLLKVGEHGTGPAVDPDERSLDLDPVTWERLSHWIARHLPGVEPEPVSSATCLYASTPDDDFVVDRIGPLVIGAGFGGHGFKFVPVIGGHLAGLATGAVWPGNPFTLDRRHQTPAGARK
jgi:sarcosine oxidase